MRILVVGAGHDRPRVVAALSAGHEVIPVSFQSTPITVDLADPASLRAMYGQAGKVGRW